MNYYLAFDNAKILKLNMILYILAIDNQINCLEINKKNCFIVLLR